jgi:uncharacterized protein (DUF2147 family)
MSDAISIHWPKEDVRKLWAQIDRAQKELGKDLGQAVRFAAWSVARSLGVKTKVAPKYREYKVIKELRGVAKRAGSKLYEVTSWKKGREHTFTTRAASVAELKAKPQVIISNAGRAKAAWMAGIKRLGSGGGMSMNRVTQKGYVAGMRSMAVEQKLSGNDPYVKITNSLPYAVSALRGGMSSVNDAMGKAARSMAKIINADIKKKLGAA